MSAGDFALDLSDPQQSGVYQADTDDLDTMAALARDAGLRILRVDLASCSDKHMLLMRLATQLDFPVSFGRNWDALSDALRDLAWLPASHGYALLINGADALARTARTIATPCWIFSMKPPLPGPRAGSHLQHLWRLRVLATESG